MLLLLLPQVPYDGTSASGYDLALTAQTALSRLGASSFADLSWLTQDELFEFFDEAAKRLATHCGAFVDRDATITLASNVARYPAPRGWTSTIHVSANGARLRPTSVAELESLDVAWMLTADTPKRYSMDAGPLGTITMYPLPVSEDQGTPLAIIQHEFPVEISTTQTIAPIPTPASDYFLYFALMRARGKQSESAMPEMASHFEQRVQLFEQIFTQYYGEGE